MAKVGIRKPKDGRPHLEWYDANGKVQRVWTHTHDDETIAQLQQMVQFLVDKAHGTIVAALTGKSHTVLAMYEAWLSTPDEPGKKPGVRHAPSDGKRAEHVEAWLAPAHDLRDAIAAWQQDGARAAQAAMVLRYCEEEFAGKPVAVADYTKARLVTHLRTLTFRGPDGPPASLSTKKNHRSAHSLFQRWLMTQPHYGFGDMNFAITIASDELFRVGDAGKLDRMREKKAKVSTNMTMAQAEQLIVAMSTETPVEREHRAMCALMASSGVEAGGCASLAIADCNELQNEVTIHAEVEHRDWRAKNEHRSGQRIIEVAEPWAMKIFWAWVAEVRELDVPDARQLDAPRVFPSFIGYMTPAKIARLKKTQRFKHQRYLTENPEFERENLRETGLDMLRTAVEHFNAAHPSAPLPVACTLHDFRHTFQQYHDQLIDAGLAGRRNRAWLKAQMGHAASSRVGERNYGEQTAALRERVTKERREAIAAERAGKVRPIRQAGQ